MIGQFRERRVDLIGSVVPALERGDWRTALSALADAEPDVDEPQIELVWCLRCVARSMRLQCAGGDPRAAAHQLDAAADLLRGAAVQRGRNGTSRRTQQLTEGAWRLVHRERADLEALRTVVRGLPRGQAELTCAGVEWLTWVEFDPWTVRRHPRERELLDLDGDAYARFHTANRRDLIERTTHLRRFAGVPGGSVWRAGGYPSVREAALFVLSREPHTRGERDLPVRTGRLRAWTYARSVTRDVG